MSILFIIFMFLFSFLLTGLIYYLRIMSSSKAHEAILAKQASHSSPTSRLGGVAILIPLSIGILIFNDKYAILIFISAGFIGLGGLLEDIGFEIRPFIRLMGAITSGFCAIYLTRIWLDDIDLTIMSGVLAYSPIAILFTAFASAGVSNSINLIDGLNGLASGVIILIALGLYLVSTHLGEQELASLCLLTMVSVAGFFIWNFPKGLVFLGDAGAYTLGHILVWIAIILTHNHTEISAWAIMCIFFWPIMDTLLAIIRRVAKKTSFNKPDRMHYHHVIMRSLIILSQGKLDTSFANPMTTSIIIPLYSGVVFIGVVFIENNPMSILSNCLFVLLFIFLYVLLVFLVRSNNLQKTIYSVLRK